MAGFSKIYCIGGSGGFAGSDGINPMLLQIWVGDSSRQWLEVHYFTKNIKPLKGIVRMVPDGPNSDNALLDACLLFYPDYFRSCPSLQEAAKILPADSQFFDIDAVGVSLAWQKLREEARPLLSTLVVYEAFLEPMKL